MKAIILKMLFLMVIFNLKGQENQFKNTYNLYPFPQSKKSTIFLSPLPGRINLQEDMAKINQNNIKNIVVLVSHEELIEYKVSDLLDHYKESNIKILHSPIIDFGLPSIQQMESILKFMRQSVKSNENLLVHCLGGYGRSGTVMGCYARQYHKKTGIDAIKYVRLIRGEDAIETKEQEDFVKKW